MRFTTSAPSRRHVALAACTFALLQMLAPNACAITTDAAFEATPWPKSKATPDFSLQDAEGKTWSLAEAKGRVVLVNFWATWCEPCRAEMPSLQAMADFYGKDVLVLAVNFKERENKVTQYARSARIALPLPMDRDGAVAARYGVKVFPSTIVIGRDGQARLAVKGEVDWTGQEAARWIEPLLR